MQGVLLPQSRVREDAVKPQGRLCFSRHTGLRPRALSLPLLALPMLGFPPPGFGT